LTGPWMGRHARDERDGKDSGMKKTILMMVAMMVVGVAFAGEGEAIERLLNSRSAMSPKAYEQAAKEVRAAADAGGVLQQYVIAIVSEDPDAPKAVRLDDKTRAAWLESARVKIKILAEVKNNAFAWYLLSLEKNDMKALEKAVDGGNVQALNAYGTVLVSEAARGQRNGASGGPEPRPMDNSTNVVAMVARAFECFKQAAAKKDANGYYNLGMCYMQGIGCNPDASRAFQCFRAAAEEGHPEAINNIGGFYRDGIGVEINPATSVKWFQKSAELGNPYGQLNYALALQRGEGVKPDEEQALKLFKAAADAGLPEAMTAYGMCLFNGQGVDKDVKAAIKLFEKAAEMGFPPAMDNIAVCYERGEGVEKDVMKSAYWKMKAKAATGDAEARAWMKRQGTGNR